MVQIALAKDWIPKKTDKIKSFLNVSPLNIMDILWSVFLISSLYYDPQSARINVQSSQRKSTPMRLTLNYRHIFDHLISAFHIIQKYL